MLRKALFAIVLCAILLSTLPAFADVSFGRSARSTAMGGAGLAVLDEPLKTAVINPAAMALVAVATRLIFPSIDLRTDGTSVNKLVDNLDLLNDADTESAIALAQEFGTKPTLLNVDVQIGLLASQIALEVGQEDLAGIFPNDAFAAWATDGTIPANPSDARVAVVENVLTILPAFAAGWRIPWVDRGQFYVGARTKWIHSTHYFQNLTLEKPQGSETATIIPDGPETKDEDDGFAMDIGMAFQTDSRHQTAYGLVATNLMRTSLKGIAQERMVSVGFSTRPSPNLLIAADLVNIWRAYDEPVKLRLGVEYMINRKIALRAGYSGDYFTYGFGLNGYDFAFSSSTPFSIAQTLAF